MGFINERILGMALAGCLSSALLLAPGPVSEHLLKFQNGGQKSAEPSVNVTGEIMDSRCAVDGSHVRMRETGTTDAKSCTLACAHKGGSFVLYDAGTKTVYQLDDQRKPEQFAGQKVRVSGMYEEESKTIHVQTIEPAEKAPQK